MASPRPINTNSSASNNRRMSNQNLAESPFRQYARFGTPPPGSIPSFIGSKGNSRRTSFDGTSGNGNGGHGGNGVDGQSNPFVPGSFQSGHNFGANHLGGIGAMVRSATPSVYSLNVDNPDPEVVKVVGRHLVTDEDIAASSYKSQTFGNNNNNSNNNNNTNNNNSSNGQKSGSAASNSERGNSANTADSNNNTSTAGNDSAAAGPSSGNGETFDSLKLQGGDITRQLYKWQQDNDPGSLRGKFRQARSKSFDMPRPVNPDAQNMNVPGGFRRNFISQRAQEQSQASPSFLTRNFIEFLSLYGHFAGEELEEEDEYDEDAIDDNDNPQYSSRGMGGEEPNEETSLLPHQKNIKHTTANATPTKAVLLLLKSFIGTGVLFLPRAFLNGGILFSSVILILVASLSQVCFILLIQTKQAVGVPSFGAIGGKLYGQVMRRMILTSLVISQIGFAAAYIVFTSENLQALILAVTNHKTLINIETLIVLQLLIFLPLSMVRNIAKLSGTALVADFFILLGLLYLYYWGGFTIAKHGVSDVKLFNPKDWTLFIGTAIFTFEGIGLIIPIQESMKKPKAFPKVLGGVMIGITLVFVSMGALCYAAYGSKVKTVVILNLPQDSQFVNGVQLLYSLAILLSTPLQLFPAIRILENALFVRSGKHNTKIKWQKNVFRFFLVFFTALIARGGANDLDKFVAVIGSFACIPLGYIYPPMLHLKACAKTMPVKILDIALIGVGISSMAYTTYSTASSWISNP